MGAERVGLDAGTEPAGAMGCSRDGGRWNTTKINITTAAAARPVESGSHQRTRDP
ncbi:MAG TPA: hypothetical protein VGD29_13240 [Actinoplanes sp.]|jgi:hypothetical protein